MNPLLVIEQAPDEFGLVRTECACPDCVLNCQTMPGMLAPGDLDRLMPLGVDALAWAEDHLRASPGVKMAGVVGGQLVIVEVPTLVPADRPDGSCHWLTPEGRCSVHAVSPAGCRYFGHERTAREADMKSLKIVKAVADAHRDRALYSELWMHLWERGLRTPPPEVKRARKAAILAGTETLL